MLAYQGDKIVKSMKKLPFQAILLVIGDKVGKILGINMNLIETSIRELLSVFDHL